MYPPLIRLPLILFLLMAPMNKYIPVFRLKV
jgi:hypothetical protein